MSNTTKLLIWVLFGPAVAALLGVLVLKGHDLAWSRALESAARMNGVAVPAGPSFTAMCADPVLALPSCADLPVGKALFVTASVAGVLALALFGGLLDARRRAAGGRSQLLRAFRPTLSLTVGILGVLMVLNAALAVMTILLLGHTDWLLWYAGTFIVIALMSGLERLRRVVSSQRQASGNEVMGGRRLRPAESPNLRALVAEVAGRVGTAPPRHLIVGLMPNFFATQSPITCAGERLTGRTLFISLPWCRVLSTGELASVIGHELGHFKGRDTEFGESTSSIYRGAIDTLIALIQDVNRGVWHGFLLQPALYAFIVFLEGFQKAESAISRDREHVADQAAVTASNADDAAAALVKAHAFISVWDDVDGDARELREDGVVDNFSMLFAERVEERAAERTPGKDPFANLLDQQLADPTDSHPPLGARLAHIGVTLEEIRERALDVRPADAAAALVDNIESIERGLTAALNEAWIALHAEAKGGWLQRAAPLAAVALVFAFAFGVASFGQKSFPRPWFAPTPVQGKSAPPLPVMPDVPDRAALLALLRDRQFDALERELADAVRRSRETPGGEIIAATAFRTFWIADSSIAALLDQWVARYSNSALARLARARHSAALGWAARGTKWGKDTSARQFAQMHEFHDSARRDVWAALQRDRTLIEAHAELIQLAANQPISECEALGASALRLAPASYRLRSVILECLEPRWGGSFERMRAFALVSQHYARENPRLPALLGYVESDLGRTLGSDDREVEAIAAYTAALSHGPDAMFYEWRASSYREVGDYQRALADTDTALTLVPQNPELLADRARSLDKLGRPVEALTAIALAGRIDPSHEDVKRWSPYLRQRSVRAASALAKEGVTSGAALAFDAVIQADPTNVETFYRRGRAYLKSGDMARAREDFERAVKLDPTHFESYRNLDYLLAREQRWDEIVAMWTGYLTRKPDDGAAYLERAGAERRKGDMPQAIADVRRACELGNAEACAIARSLPPQPSTSS